MGQHHLWTVNLFNDLHFSLTRTKNTYYTDYIKSLLQWPRANTLNVSYLFGMIIQVKVVFRKTVVGDRHFDYLTHLQSQVKSCHQMIVHCIFVSGLGSQ